MENSDQPLSLQSMCHVRSSEAFPKCVLQSEDPRLVVPFTPICGEAVEYLGRTTDGVLALSNYRLHLSDGGPLSHNVPLGLVELLEVRDLFYLHVGCKDSRSLRLCFPTNELCLAWFRRLDAATNPPAKIEDAFAFAFHAWAGDEGGEEARARLGGGGSFYSILRSEVERLGLDLHGAWRVSGVNAEWQLCPSYPRLLLVPACISDDTLECVARFRSARRVPSVVWRHRGNGAVIARCSQPEVGWLGWRSSEDEDLLKAIADACAFDRGRNTMLDHPPLRSPSPLPQPPPATATPPGETLDEGGGGKPPLQQHQDKKVLIVDARSYTTAVANRARGGGCECPEYYPSCDIQFMNLANIHSVRKSFHAVRQLCASATEQPNWFSLLEATRWLQHMAGLLRSAVTVVAAVEQEGRPVLVHCSDGWDRTPQIVALAELLLDPYYRTIHGFQVLCEREWLDFGHKFADRCGHAVGSSDPNERCPVFLQWLDCVHQLLLQFPCGFEFSSCYLVKLAQHAYSNLFGTFLCNSTQERHTLNVSERTFSVWRFLRTPNFRNHLYSARDQVLWPSCNVRDLVLWSEVYIGSLEPCPKSPAHPMPGDGIANDSPAPDISPPPAGPSMIVPGAPVGKTRSCDDLVAVAGGHSEGLRRSSDPSIGVDIKLEGLTLLDVGEPAPLFPGPQLQHPDSDDETEDVTEDSSSQRQPQQPYQLPGAPPAHGLSVDSSTDTLVAAACPELITNGHVEPQRDHSQVCRVCATSRRFLAGDGGGGGSGGTTTSSSRYSTPPLHSRTPSTPGCEDGHHQQRPGGGLDDVDGLVPLHNDVQHRLQQIMDDHKAKEDGLQRELYTTRIALLRQVCHHCSHNGTDTALDEAGSLPESVCSGEVPSAGESLPSDVSWEAVEERDACPTLWVPDHAVSRCTGCDTEFWLGRRKHHCRNCGRIFCADCSENTLPLPDEQLYDPVRVCAACFSVLHPTQRRHHDCAPDSCRQEAARAGGRSSGGLASTT